MTINKQKWMPRSVRRFRKEESGATAVEFALVGGPFFLLIFAIIESALYFFAGQYLESTVDEVTRLFRTGQIDPAITDQQFLDQYFCPRLVNIFQQKCEDGEIILHVQTAGTFAGLADPPNLVETTQPDGTKTSDLAAGTFTAPGSEEILQVTAQVKWPIYTNFAAPLVNTPNGNFALISATAVTRTEPF